MPGVHIDGQHVASGAQQQRIQRGTQGAKVVPAGFVGRAQLSQRLMKMEKCAHLEGCVVYRSPRDPVRQTRGPVQVGDNELE